ncbi:F-box/LRR-repeat protein 18 isoform X1 [Xenopus laevis]|uniref:F-box/LRR-repeat protein 18 isoform X1 n=1 Tax=Xenopus laevis TaxID=8355 RepID=A0A8J0TVP6_XENLA|nr:F-box/LRR-repeat protein 18 isoform X1 [Xenopus laevis]XP_018091743.1 F-box/LRR-repeat protein 18 isoform X1 [Xenopus laevis]
MDPTELSDEILLHILRYVPSTDLILNVKRTCRKLADLCLDKSLIQKVILHKEYQASDNQVKQMLREAGKEIRELDMSGCYWLSSSTVDLITQCKRLVRLDLSGCPLTSLRLSKLLSDLHQLSSLSIDVGAGFDSGQLTTECKATLRHVRELKQTLFAPSYGVVPCCVNLEKLLLYFEVLDRTREGTVMSGQLMVGESKIPHYQNLRLFYARLAPGYINEEVVRLYLTVFTDRTPENLRAFLISVPGSLAESSASKNLLDSMAKNVSLEAFQLPKSWLNGSSLLQHLKFSCPFYLSFSHSMISGGQLTQWVINGHMDCRSLVSLNLRACPFCLAPDLPFKKTVENIDCSILETLVTACPNLAHLNLSYAHHHSSENATRHLCDILAQLKHLRSLSLPVCAIVDTSSPTDKSLLQCPGQSTSRTATLGFGKKVRIGVQTDRMTLPDQNSCFWKLLKENPFIVHLELIGSNFYSAMPRNDPAIRNAYPPCALSHSVGDAQISNISELEFLQNLTLAQLPGIHTGSALVSIGMKCQQLRSLSLANLGMKGMVLYIASLCEMLSHCKHLKDLRLEQPYFSANGQFFQALSHCSSLQRLCIVSHNGNFQPDAVMSFISACPSLVVCHMFTGETLKACRNLQQSIKQSFQAERPALNVLIFPLLHESLADVIRDVPLMHLDEITLFKSRVAEEPSQLWC